GKLAPPAMRGGESSWRLVLAPAPAGSGRGFRHRRMRRVTPEMACGDGHFGQNVAQIEWINSPSSTGHPLSSQPPRPRPGADRNRRMMMQGSFNPGTTDAMVRDSHSANGEPSMSLHGTYDPQNVFAQIIRGEAP